MYVAGALTRSSGKRGTFYFRDQANRLLCHRSYARRTAGWRCRLRRQRRFSEPELQPDIVDIVARRAADAPSRRPASLHRRLRPPPAIPGCVGGWRHGREERNARTGHASELIRSRSPTPPWRDRQLPAPAARLRRPVHDSGHAPTAPSGIERKRLGRRRKQPLRHLQTSRCELAFLDGFRKRPSPALPE